MLALASFSGCCGCLPTRHSLSDECRVYVIPLSQHRHSPSHTRRTSARSRRTPVRTLPLGQWWRSENMGTAVAPRPASLHTSGGHYLRLRRRRKRLTLPPASKADERAQLWPHNGGRPDFSRLTCTARCHRLVGHAIQVVPVTAASTQARPRGRKDVLSWRRGCRRRRRWCLQHMFGPKVRKPPAV